MTALLSILASFALAQAEPATLRQVYEWAVPVSQELAVRRELVEQSKQRGRAALGYALPRLEWEGSETYQDPGGVDKLRAQGFGGFVEKEQFESKFTLTQTLFSGLREQSARKGYKKETERDRFLLARGAAELYERTADLFYDVLARETERANTESAMKLAEARVKELEGFLKLGKARESEVFSARAQASSLRGGLHNVDARIAAAREQLSRLTRRHMEGQPLLDDPPGAPTPPSLDAAVAKAKDRSDIRAQREEIAARAQRVKYERGLYSPRLDLLGTYYTHRATFLDQLDWDVKLTAKFPLFQGGGAVATVRGAESALRMAQAQAERFEQDVEVSVRTLHASLVAAIEEARSLQDAATAAELGYEALMKEYKLGLVTNLEVLSSLDLLQAQRRARDDARFNAKRLAVRLDAAIEAVP